MKNIVSLPYLGETVTEGVLRKWLKQPGDSVEKFEFLAEVLTDKVSIEVPSPLPGKVIALLVNEGDTIPIGMPILEMEISEGTVDPFNGTTEKLDATPVAPGKTGIFLKDLEPLGPTGVKDRDLPMQNLQSRSVPFKSEEFRDKRNGWMRHKYSPVVRRIAIEYAVDLNTIIGTGSGGRITKKDVLLHIESYKDKKGSAVQSQNLSEDPEFVLTTPARKSIAQIVENSVAVIPQAWMMIEVDMSGLVHYREAEKKGFLEREGIQLTYFPFAMLVVVSALKNHQLINSTWSDEGIIVKKAINLGIAVATTNGIMVPVIKNAGNLTFRQLAAESHRLIMMARQGELKQNEIIDGTFTLNNTGAFGSVLSRPLLLPGQSGMLTTESIVNRAVVSSDGTIVPRAIMNMCLSFDHRVLDGADAAEFLRTVKNGLEDPLLVTGLEGKKLNV